MSRPHGEHVAGLGYYDAGRGAWVDTPPKSGGNERQVRRLSTMTFRDDVPSTEELRARSSSSFERNGQYERARALRDSDRPEDREKWRSLPSSLRISVATYEQQARDVLDAGGRLPKDVQKPPPAPDAA